MIYSLHTTPCSRNSRMGCKYSKHLLKALHYGSIQSGKPFAKARAGLLSSPGPWASNLECRQSHGYVILYFTTLDFTIFCYAILYYTILYYTILYQTILYYTILYYTILYYTILYYTILYYTILYYTILYYTILYYTILYYTILYYTILHYTILYYTILYYTILYYTILYYTIRYYPITKQGPMLHIPQRKARVGTRVPMGTPLDDSLLSAVAWSQDGLCWGP